MGSVESRVQNHLVQPIGVYELTHHQCRSNPGPSILPNPTQKILPENAATMTEHAMRCFASLAEKVQRSKIHGSLTPATMYIIRGSCSNAEMHPV